jgi:acylphosphatase
MKIHLMKRLIAYVSGSVQKSGYRSKVIALAKRFEIKGHIENLADGRVLIIAEGEESDLERFAKALVIKNTIINVTGIEKEYKAATDEYKSFAKLVESGETDSRLDAAVDQLKALIVVTKEGVNVSREILAVTLENLAVGKETLDVSKSGFNEVNSKLDHMLSKQDIMIENQGELVEKMDESKKEIVKETRDLRKDLKPSLEDRLSRIENDVAQIKAKIGLEK